jgi:UDP-glucuronate 4-epimerase
LFAAERFDIAVNLAAQAGVRYSLENPYVYVESNILGFVGLLECCRRYSVRHVLYASSSSVYGGNTKVPFSEEDIVDTPVSLYAATKRSDELIAQVYARIYGIPLTGLRFFTVYGPWGRPDMAPMLFSRAILAGEPIRVFNGGDMERDFTYVDDIVDAVVRLLDKVPTGSVPSEVYNIGCGRPVSLMTFIRTLEASLGRKAELDMQPMQPGDVPRTWADTTKLQQKIGFRPRVPLEEGVGHFARWYLSDHNPLSDK